MWSWEINIPTKPPIGGRVSSFIFPDTTPLTSVISCGKCFNCTSQSTCGTRRYTCCHADRLWYNYICGYHYHQLNSVTHPKRPTKATPVDNMVYLVKYTMSQNPLFTPTYQVFNDPLYMVDEITKSNIKFSAPLVMLSTKMMRLKLMEILRMIQPGTSVGPLWRPCQYRATIYWQGC